MSAPAATTARRLLYLCAALAALAHLRIAFLTPGSFAYDPYAIPDDARQFLAWTPRLGDPHLLAGDLLADYWQSVSPPLYRLVFIAASTLGIAPLIAARLLALPLLAVATWSAWRLAVRLAPGPRAAFVAAALLMSFVVHDNSIFSATPRAFGPPLLLLFFYGFVARRWLVIGVSLALLGAVYPAPAIVGVTMLGLSAIQRLWPPRIDLSPRTLLLVGGVALLTAAAMLPLALQTGGWGPALTLDQARALPAMMNPGGRSSMVDATGTIGWICSRRMGFVPPVLPCDGAPPIAALWNMLLFAPVLVLAVRGLRGGANRLYTLALAAALFWHVAATLVAFRLHLPSRYSQRVLEPLQWLAIGQLIGGWIEARWHTASRPVRQGAAALAGVLALGAFLTPASAIERPRDPALIRRIAALPATARIGGVSEALAFVPALTGRAVPASTEHAIPYQQGYYGRIERRLRASLAAVSAPDAGTLRQALAEAPVDYLLVENAMFAERRIGGRYPDILPAESEAASGRLRAGTPLLVRAIPACGIYRSAAFALIDARCAVALPDDATARD